MQCTTSKGNIFPLPAMNTCIEKHIQLKYPLVKSMIQQKFCIQIIVHKFKRNLFHTQQKCVKVNQDQKNLILPFERYTSVLIFTECANLAAIRQKLIQPKLVATISRKVVNEGHTRRKRVYFSQKTRFNSQYLIVNRVHCFVL